jgi:outer membrane receptor for ferrienterochelin and colicins
VLWVLAAAGGLAQEPHATLRIEVTSAAGAVGGATIVANRELVHTDANGIATLQVPPGPVEVKVTKEGFLPHTQRLTIDAAREWAIRFELQPAEEVEEQVTVYATRTDQRLQDSALRVEVLGKEEIEEKTMMTPGDIVMMLNEMGGLRVQTTSPSLGAASVRIQGMRGRYTRFLTDGLPLFGQQGGGLGLLQIPPSDLGQVEVIKGIASSLYGGGAMGGVVNLIARRPGAEPVREFLINRSSLGATDATMFVGSKLSAQWSGSLLAGGHWQERSDRDGDGWADLARYERGVVRPRMYWDDGKGHTAMLTGGLTLEDRDGGTVAGAVLRATGAPYREALETRRFDAGGNVQSVFGGRYVGTARFAVSSQRHDHEFGEARERDRHEMLFGEGSIRGKSGRHTWVAGMAVERDAYRPRDVPRFAYEYVTPGVFAEDDVAIRSWLSVSASARADFQNEYGTFLSPRLSMLARGGGWISRASLGSGFAAPSPLTEETEAAGLSRLEIPARLVAERGRSLSLDVTRTVGAASVTATYFASSVRHAVEVRREPNRFELINAGEPVINRGVEFLGTWRKAPFAATASYSYVRARKTEAGVGTDVPLTPRHSAGLVAMWEKERAGRVGIECYYTGTQRLEQNPYRGESRPYFVLGALVERKVGPLRLFVNFENLTDVRQTRWDPIVRPSRSADGRWTVDAWAPLDGRVINGGVRLQL